ncbi:MAG: hypothetical protein ACSLEM_04815 [Candidatus Malihini olakiniferum]
MIISILVVLYGKKAEDSSSLKSLFNALSSDFFFDKVNIFIFNNGPSLISLDEIQKSWEKMTKKEIYLSFAKDISNRPLSLIYNDFIEMFCFSDKYILLDDDSVLHTNFFECILRNEDFDLILPLIESDYDKKTYYPVVDGVVFFEEAKRLKNELSYIKINSISSGLTLSSNLVSCFKKRYNSVFDENYALYGVDSSFFLRLNKFAKKRVVFKIMSGYKIQHSLSRVSKKTSHENMKERIIDTGVSLRHYPSFIVFYYAFKLILVQIVKGRFSLISAFFLHFLMVVIPDVNS